MNIKVKLQNKIATLTLNRPEKHNAFNAEMIVEITQALQSIENNPDIHAVVMNASGKHFCAGADLNYMKASADFSHDENSADAQRLGQLFATLDRLIKPTVCVVQGAAFGGALGLIACSDITICADNARFAFSEVKLGLAPATIAPYVINAIGMRAARRYFLTAEQFSAADALKIGLVHEVVGLQDLESTAEKVTTSILANSLPAMVATKKLIHQCCLLDQGIIKETYQLIAELRASPEAQKRLQAFLNK